MLIGVPVALLNVTTLVPAFPNVVFPLLVNPETVIALVVVAPLPVTESNVSTSELI